MAWIEIEKHRNHIAADEVTVALFPPHGGSKRTNPQMVVRIARAMIGQLDWQHGDKMRLLFGTGEHHGQARLEQSEAGSLTLSYRSGTTKSALAITTTALPDWLKRDPRKTRPIKARVVDGGMEFAFPAEWCTKAAPRDRGLMALKPARNGRQPPMIDRTAELMGDPRRGDMA